MAFDFDQQDLATIQKALRNAVTEVLDLRPVAIGQKWKGGTLVIKPDDPGSASKEMPLESFFHNGWLVFVNGFTRSSFFREVCN